MTANHSTQHSNPCPPVESYALSPGGLVGAMIVWGLFLATVNLSMTDVDTAIAAPAAPQPKLAVIASHTPVAMPVADDVMPDAPMPVDLYRFALNALLVPLIDDAVPPRWTDIAMDYFCDPGTTVMIDGKPMVPGELVPAKAFKVRWDMSRCAPLGPQSVALSGGVELVVFHEDVGLSAMVIPDRLQVDSHLGRVALRGPFAAETSLVTTAFRQ